ncbi:MAG: response regulator [Gemmatimonadaceae bacterium]
MFHIQSSLHSNHKSARPPLVLIANEQEWSARSLESILAPNGYAVVRAYSGRQALELARSAQPDVVIVDVRLPDLDGLEVCEILRDDSRVSGATPVIVTASGPASRAQRLAAFRAGAWEFAGQPLDGEVLLLRLATFMKAKRVSDDVRDDSLLDQVTGLYNLRGLARRAREIGADAVRRHDALACVAIAPTADLALAPGRDMDEATARIVERLGNVCRNSARASDAVGRLGRAEFAIIAPATEAAGAVRLVERLRASIEAVPIAVDGSERRVKIRAGYCAVPDFAQSSVDAVEMLLRATTALKQLRDDRTSDGSIGIRAFDEIPLSPVA